MCKKGNHWIWMCVCCFLSSFVAVSVAVAAAVAAEPPVERIVWVFGDDLSQVRGHIQSLRLTVEDVTDEGFQARATDEQLAKLTEYGYRYKVLWEDAMDRAMDRKQRMMDDLLWTGYSSLVSHMQTVAAENPDIVRLHTVGTTVQGRTIYVMEITDEPDYDDPLEAEVRFIGNIHGDEYMSLELMVLLIDYLVDNYGTDPDISYLVNNREIWIQASVNPDGHENGSRYNANYIDLNRNHGYYWGGEGACSFSEPEVRVLREYSLDRNFSLSLSFHGETTYINYVWNFSPNATPDESYIDTLSWGYYNHQLPGQGYTVINGWDWYQTNGDTNDWSYGCRGDIDWTIETPGYTSGAIQQDWDNNRDAILYIADQAGYGMQGVVTDATTGAPLEAVVTILQAPWPVYTDPAAGDYHRVLAAGTYDVMVWANGYSTGYGYDIDVPDQGTVTFDIALNRNFQICAQQVCTYEVTSYYTSNYTNLAYPHYALGPSD
ncbi:carboxypeptidase regulatory-like domain-containing protein, partial [bacterium]|nr:carboxypeptidase regulatory-like domain-containing protein [candidate division CSSED10-310 bacterium]